MNAKFKCELYFLARPLRIYDDDFRLIIYPEGNFTCDIQDAGLFVNGQISPSPGIVTIVGVVCNSFTTWANFIGTRHSEEGSFFDYAYKRIMFVLGKTADQDCPSKCIYLSEHELCGTCKNVYEITI